jgi:hypothetical protein
MHPRRVGSTASHVGAAAAIGKRNGLDSVATTRGRSWATNVMEAFRSLCRLGQEVRRLSNGTTKMTTGKGDIADTYIPAARSPLFFG